VNIPLDFGQIELLAELGELNSISAASARIGLSQSAGSHALARLRVTLGDPLFVRTSGGLRPTPYGAGVARAAAEALRGLRESLEAGRSFDPTNTRRNFTVYMTDVGQTVFLPPLLAMFGGEAPAVSLGVAPIPAEGQAAALESGEVDVALGFFTTLTSGFRQRLLFRERYVCVTRADHPAFSRGMTLEAFYATGQAITTASGAGHRLLDHLLERQRIRRRVVLSVPQFLSLPLVIAESDLLVMVPSQLAEVFARLVPLKVMQPPIRIPAYDIRVYWHERYHHDAANRWLREQFIRMFHR
jgi:DNA-binding transcriptional LysR family regulator